MVVMKSSFERSQQNIKMQETLITKSGNICIDVMNEAQTEMSV